MQSHAVLLTTQYLVLDLVIHTERGWSIGSRSPPYSVQCSLFNFLMSKDQEKEKAPRSNHRLNLPQVLGAVKPTTPQWSHSQRPRTPPYPNCMEYPPYEQTNKTSARMEDLTKPRDPDWIPTWPPSVNGTLRTQPMASLVSSGQKACPLTLMEEIDKLPCMCNTCTEREDSANHEIIMSS